METMQAFMRGEQARRQGARSKVFDWNKAAEILAKTPHTTAVAGLKSDMEWTAGVISRNGEPVHDDYTFLASNWATPVLVVDDDDETPCWVWDDEAEGWDSDTKWPESAIEILTRPGVPE